MLDPGMAQYVRLEGPANLGQAANIAMRWQEGLGDNTNTSQPQNQLWAANTPPQPSLHAVNTTNTEPSNPPTVETLEPAELAAYRVWQKSQKGKKAAPTASAENQKEEGATGGHSRKRPVRCYNCKEVGHMASDCPKQRQLEETIKLLQEQVAKLLSGNGKGTQN